MEKKEKKSDIEQLLNSLIEKGWKPRWENVNKVIKTWIDEFGDGYVLFDGELNWYKQRWCNMTELVSKWSWLWQFVCKNGMVGRWDWITKRKKVKDTDSWSWDEVIYYSVIWSYNETDYQYRVIESVLCDEDKLEEFLLNSIKLD